MSERKVSVREIITALESGGTNVTDKHRQEAFFQSRCAESDEARRSLRNDLHLISRKSVERS